MRPAFSFLLDFFYYLSEKKMVKKPGDANQAKEPREIGYLKTKLMMYLFSLEIDVAIRNQ